MSTLPNGWAISTIGDVVEKIVGGGTPSKSINGYFEGDFPFMTVKDMRVSRPADTIDKITQEAIKNSSTNVIEKNTLIVSTRMGLGKIVSVNFPVAINQDLKALYLPKSINKSFFEYQYRHLAKLIESLGTGTTVKGIRVETLKEIELAIPPLNEQIRIADKLDSVLAKVDAAQARLEKIPTLLKRFRQSVLAAATSGELTREWSGIADTKIESNLKVPTGWKVKKASDACLKVQSGSTPRDKPFEKKGTIPFLKVYNIVNQKIDFDYKPQFVLREVHEKGLKRSIAYPGDVLMNIVGPPLGKVALLTGQYSEWNINQAITLFRANPEVLNPDYLYYVLCEGRVVRELLPETKGQVGQINISLTQCREALIQVPSLEEQNEIVRRVESLFALADVVEKQYLAAKQRLDRLTQSLLAKAFRGELVSQDPGDEPASELLKRIQAERQQQATEKPRRKASARGSQNTIASKQTKTNTMQLKDAPENYLLELLAQLGGETHAEVLWKKSELAIDDFYAKLKQEMQTNGIFEDKNSPDPALRKLKVANR